MKPSILSEPTRAALKPALKAPDEIDKLFDRFDALLYSEKPWLSCFWFGDAQRETEQEPQQLDSTDDLELPPATSWVEDEQPATARSVREDGDEAEHRGSLGQSSTGPRDGSRGHLLSPASFSHVRSRASVAAARLVRLNKQQTHEEEREESAARLADEVTRKELFLGQQKERISAFHTGEVDKLRAIEADKATKRQVGVDMRASIRAAYHQVQQTEQARVAVVSAETHRVRREKEAATILRHQHEREHAEKVAAQAKVERAQLRDATQATVRQQAQTTRDFAAQVRYETRPEVRHVSAKYFRTQRDRVCADERERQQADRVKRAVTERAFLENAMFVVEEAQAADAATRSARNRLDESRRQAAEAVRQERKSQLQRKRQSADLAELATRRRHDEVIQDRYVEGVDGWEDEGELASAMLSMRSSRSGMSMLDWKQSRGARIGGRGSSWAPPTAFALAAMQSGAEPGETPAKSRNATPRARTPRKMTQKKQISLQVNLTQYL